MYFFFLCNSDLDTFWKNFYYLVIMFGCQCEITCHPLCKYSIMDIFLKIVPFDIYFLHHWNFYYPFHISTEVSSVSLDTILFLKKIVEVYLTLYVYIYPKSEHLTRKGLLWTLIINYLISVSFMHNILKLLNVYFG